MPSEYTIYIVNKSETKKRFFCFLDRPKDLEANPKVYANSNASVNVDTGYPGRTRFIIPIQYKINAGCSNKAVQLRIRVQADNPSDIELGQTWEANYYPPADTQGPIVTNKGATVDPKQVNFLTNTFAKNTEAEYSWYSNLSFGKETEQGFIGFTWSPEPGSSRSIQPTVKFYINYGSFESNVLAEWTEVSRNAAEVSAFSPKGEATVTLEANGSWTVTASPPTLASMIGGLGGHLSDEDVEQAALTSFSLIEDQIDTVEGVVWRDQNVQTEAGLNTYLVGTLTVRGALTASFAYFILSGIKFEIGRDRAGMSTFSFSYNGERSAASIKALFRAGATIFLGGARS